MENNMHLPLRDRVMLRDGATAYDKNFDKFSMYEKVNCITTDSTIPGLVEHPPKGTYTVSSTEVHSVKSSQLPLSIQPTYTLLPIIEKVIFNPPATVVIWRDGVKTVVKTSKDDVFSKETGLAMAIAKRYFGSRSKFLEAVDNAEGEVLETPTPARNTEVAYLCDGKVSIGEALCSPIAAK